METPIHRVAWQRDNGPALGEPSEVGESEANPSDLRFAFFLRRQAQGQYETTDHHDQA
jgi:hypothetical protein